MRQEMCLVCTDKKKYEMSVSIANRIVFRLQNMVDDISNDFNREEHELLNQLRMFNKHIHFMCGHCYRVNSMELRNLEDKMDSLLVLIARNIKTKDNIYHDTLLLLCGDYSGKHQVFQKYCLQKINEGE